VQEHGSGPDHQPRKDLDQWLHAYCLIILVGTNLVVTLGVLSKLLLVHT
jgi:hypothetical protein